MRGSLTVRVSLLVRAVCRAALAAAFALPSQAPAQPSMGTGQTDLFQSGTQPRDYIELRAGVIHSDNVELASTDPVSGNIPTAGLGIDFAHKGPRLAFDARGDVNWQDYPSNTFGSGVLGNLDARAALALVPQSFIWSAEGTFGQLVLNPLGAVTPDNL